MPIAILSGLMIFKIVERINIKNVKWLTFSLVSIYMFAFLGLVPNVSGVEFTIFKDGRLNDPYVNQIVSAINKTPSNSTIFLSQVIAPEFDYFKNDNRNLVDISIYWANDYLWTMELLKGEMDKTKYLIDDGICSYGNQCDFIYENFDLYEIEKIDSTRIFELK